jgi:uncharacterized OsmC-like protein
MQQINGMDVDELRGVAAAAAADPRKADRDPVVRARWLGGDLAELTMASGGAPVYIGGDDAPGAMRMLLMSMAACDVDVIASRASLLGIEIESLSVEATGHFNVQRYLGLDVPVGPGYERIGYTVRLKTRGATPEQLEDLRVACEADSPVVDTLKREVEITLDFRGDDAHGTASAG